MKVVNITRVQIEVKLADGSGAFILPRQTLSGVDSDSYESNKQFLRLLSVEKGDYRNTKSKGAKVEKKPVEEEAEEEGGKHIDVVGYKPQKSEVVENVVVVERPKKKKSRKGKKK